MIGLMAIPTLDGSLFAFPWLFAFDVTEWIGFAVFLIVAIISAISQYFNKQKEQRRLEEQARRRAAMADIEQPEERPQEPQRPFGRLPERPRPAAAPVDNNVASEIRDFLERAATGRPVGQGPAGPKPVPPIVAVPMAPTENVHTPLSDRPTHHTSIEQRPTPTSHPVEAKPVPHRQMTKQDRRRAEKLQAKKQAEAKHRQAAAARKKADSKPSSVESGPKFDRKLGTLSQQTRSQSSGRSEVVSAETMTSDLVTMFTDPGHLRQAIVINEILSRPLHRWE